MANRPTMYQDGFFYSDSWSKDVTRFLIDGLIREIFFGNWEWNGQNTDAISSVRDRLNSHFNRHFDANNVHQRVRFMRNRYRIFELLVQRSDVHWDEDENVVYASPITWETLRQEYPLTKAYIYQGDPLYESLKVLFSSPLQDHDDEPDDIPVVIDGPINNQPNTTASMSNLNTIRQPPRPPHLTRRNPMLLNFYSDDSDSSTSS